MLQLTNLVGFGAGASASSAVSNYLIDIITELGLTSGLNFVLDFADSRSYDGSSQSITDATGNGNTFFRGATSGAEASDPTFNGSIGNPTESTYMSFDGGDFLTENGSLTFAENWHKNNGAFTIVTLYYTPAAKASVSALFSTRDDNTTSDAGVNLYVTSTGKIRLRRSTSTTTTQITNTSVPTVATGWNFIGAGFDEATTTLRARINGSTEDVTGLTASTDTDPNTFEYTIGAEYDSGAAPSGGYDSFIQSGERLACIAGWSSLLSDANLALIYNRLKNRVTLP